MKVPNNESAVIPQAKISGYLLSFAHRDGRGKAKFFHQYGFAADNWEELASALRHHVVENEVTKIEDTPFGTRYVVEGSIFAPDGRALFIRSVWFLPAEENVPWFVTAYPLKRRQR